MGVIRGRVRAGPWGRGRASAWSRGRVPQGKNKSVPVQPHHPFMEAMRLFSTELPEIFSAVTGLI